MTCPAHRRTSLPCAFCQLEARLPLLHDYRLAAIARYVKTNPRPSPTLRRASPLGAARPRYQARVGVSLKYPPHLGKHMRPYTPNEAWPRLLLASLLIAIVGCTPTLDPLHPTPTVITNYKIGVEQTAGIGDAIFNVESARKVPEFVALRAYDPGHIRFQSNPTHIDQGTRFRAIGKMKDGNYVIRSRIDTTAMEMVVTPDGRGLGYLDNRGGYSGGTWPTEPLFAAAEGMEGQEGAFRAQMIYSGLTGNTVRTAYREFTGDFIRPAFTQELQYNLSQDSTIAYKSIKIQILEASNSQLRYRVKEDGGLPWLSR